MQEKRDCADGQTQQQPMYVVVILLWPAYNVKRKRIDMDAYTHHKWRRLVVFRGDIIFLFLHREMGAFFFIIWGKEMVEGMAAPSSSRHIQNDGVCTRLVRFSPLFIQTVNDIFVDSKRQKKRI